MVSFAILNPNSVSVRCCEGELNFDLLIQAGQDDISRLRIESFELAKDYLH